VVIEADETVWNGRFPVQLVRFRQRRFDGTMSGPRSWELLRRGKAAAVLPYDPVADLVVVIEQFRLPAFAAGLPPVMVELAAGLIDGDDTPEATIRREAVEEMGLELHELERIGDFLLTPGGCDELCTLFAGRVRLGAIGPDGLLGIGGLASEQEDIRVRALPAAHVIEQALAGAYPNSVATLGLLWFAARRDWLRARWLA
jgi:ADP-ribose pyrophosphatase